MLSCSVVCLIHECFAVFVIQCSVDMCISFIEGLQFRCLSFIDAVQCCCVVFAQLCFGFIPWRVSAQVDRKQPVLLCTDEAVSNLMKKENQKAAPR